MGVFIQDTVEQQFLYNNEFLPQLIRGGGFPTGANAPNLDCFLFPVTQAVSPTLTLDLRGFSPGTSINQNSIAVNVQPIPAGTYMSFIITPNVTVNNANHITIVFALGNNQGEVVSTLHQVTVTASDNQGTVGRLQFYYYKRP